EIGGKLHTGRKYTSTSSLPNGIDLFLGSRNEQIATDMRLWLRDELRKIEGYLSDLLKCTIARAEKEIDFIVRPNKPPPPFFSPSLSRCLCGRLVTQHQLKQQFPGYS